MLIYAEPTDVGFTLRYADGSFYRRLFGQTAARVAEIVRTHNDAGLTR